MNALKLYYLATYLGLGSVLPLFALAMEARGFRADQYRWLLVLLPLSRLLASPLWGGVADKWLGTARLLRINTFVATFAMTALALSSSVGAIVVTFALWAFFSSSLVPLAEAGTYRMLAGRAANFGYVRVFGSIGFAVAAALVAALGVDEKFRLPFMLSAISYGVSACVAMRLSDAQGSGSWLGLFASFSDVQNPNLVVVVITRGSSSRGKFAADIAGQIYKSLSGRYGNLANRPRRVGETDGPTPTLQNR